MNETINLALDSKSLEQCLKTVNNIGSTEYMNICTGQTNIIPWGSGDFLTMIMVAAFVFTFILVCGSIMWKVVFDY